VTIRRRQREIARRRSIFGLDVTPYSLPYAVVNSTGSLTAVFVLIRLTISVVPY